MKPGNTLYFLKIRFHVDYPHPRYSNHSQQERLKPLNQLFHDVNPTCKNAFFDLEFLSMFSSPYFHCHDFSASPALMFNLLLFEDDFMMTIYKLRIKPFDVLNKVELQT